MSKRKGSFVSVDYQFLCLLAQGLDDSLIISPSRPSPSQLRRQEKKRSTDDDGISTACALQFVEITGKLRKPSRDAEK